MKNKHPLVMPLKIIWVGIFMFAIAEYIIESLSIYIDFQENKCIPEYSVYLVLKKQREVKKGDLYAFSFSGNQFYEKGTRFGKFVVAVEGDAISINKDGLFINEQLYSKSEKYKAIQFKNPDDMYRDFVVAKNHFFFSTPTDNSYDSRYYGTVEQQQIIGRMIPLW